MWGADFLPSLNTVARLAWRAGAIALIIFSFTGCFSIRWRAADGYERHVGALRYTILWSDQGTQVERLALGLDVNLSGPERGFVFGFHKVLETVPKTFSVEQPETLGDSVLFHLKPEVEFQRRFIQSSGSFSLRENLSGMARYYKSSAIGIGWTKTHQGSELSLGYSSRSSYLELFSDSSTVLILTVDEKHPDRPFLIEFRIN